MEQGLKNDVEKTRLELLHPTFLVAVAKVLTFGAKKYASWNWYKGIDYGRIYGAAQRHLNAWWAGENLDSETGYSHLWHAACELMFLIVFEAEARTALDSRPQKPEATNDVS